MSKATALTERLATLYRGLERAHGIYELLPRKPGSRKAEGKARTVREEVTLNLWRLHLEGKQGLGIVPIRDDHTCYFGAIDIDKYDIAIEDIEEKVAVLGLPVLPTRTKSGGCHLYCFAKEPVPAKLMKDRLEEWSVGLGFGGSEVFPKQNQLLSTQDVGNWINMPYFGAHAKGATVDRYGIFKGQPLSLEQFIERAEFLRITEEQLEALSLPAGEEFLDGPPCLQSLARNGFGEGMRNNSLFAIGVYLKKRYPDDWASYLQTYNLQFMKPPLSQAEVQGLVKTLARKDYGYTCDKPPIKAFCNKNLCRSREFGVGKAPEDWGVAIDSECHRIETNPPHWIITVNGTRMQLFSEDLMQQRKFQELCLQKIAYLPPALPGDKWREQVNRILQSATPVEAPPDASAGGELSYYLKQFCTVYPQAETREEILVGKPFSEDGHTFFRAADFKKFLETQHFRGLTGPRMFAELRAMGLNHKQMWVAGQNVLVWSVKQYTDETPEVAARKVKPQEGDM